MVHKIAWAIVRQRSEERHDGPRALRVKTGGRLVEEKEELGLSSEFHTDSGTLLVLDAQRTDRGISVGSQATHLKTFFDATMCCQYGKLPTRRGRRTRLPSQRGRPRGVGGAWQRTAVPHEQSLAERECPSAGSNR